MSSFNDQEVNKMGEELSKITLISKTFCVCPLKCKTASDNFKTFKTLKRYNIHLLEEHFYDERTFQYLINPYEAEGLSEDENDKIKAQSDRAKLTKAKSGGAVKDDEDEDYEDEDEEVEEDEWMQVYDEELFDKVILLYFYFI
jgi:hypothetical protein